MAHQRCRLHDLDDLVVRHLGRVFLCGADGQVNPVHDLQRLGGQGSAGALVRAVFALLFARHQRRIGLVGGRGLDDDGAGHLVQYLLDGVVHRADGQATLERQLGLDHGQAHHFERIRVGLGYSEPGQDPDRVLLHLEDGAVPGVVHPVFVVDDLQHPVQGVVNLDVHGAVEVVSTHQPLRIDPLLRDQLSDAQRLGVALLDVVDGDLHPRCTVGINHEGAIVVLHGDAHHRRGVSRAGLDAVLQQRVAVGAVDGSRPAGLLRVCSLLADAAGARAPAVPLARGELGVGAHDQPAFSASTPANRAPYCSGLTSLMLVQPRPVSTV